jgi:hypothetical protein
MLKVMFRMIQYVGSNNIEMVRNMNVQDLALETSDHLRWNRWGNADRPCFDCLRGINEHEKRIH